MHETGLCILILGECKFILIRFFRILWAEDNFETRYTPHLKLPTTPHQNVSDPAYFVKSFSVSTDYLERSDSCPNKQVKRTSIIRDSKFLTNRNFSKLPPYFKVRIVLAFLVYFYFKI